jgi:peptidoglycan hydrolase CwlO-like protein
MTHTQDSQSNNNSDDNSDGGELIIDRTGEQQRLLGEIAQSTQDASDELRMMNDNIESLTREVHGTKEAIKSLTEVLKKNLDKKP